MSHLTEDEKAKLGLGHELQREWKATLERPSEPLRFYAVEQNPHILLKIGANAEACTQQLEVFSSSGLKIVSMDYNGVITSHVEDPIAAINEMLDSKVCQQWESGQMRAYLLLLRSYFSLPQPDSWKKNPLL